MATIMQVGSRDGTRRCDETCHKAREPHCECVCAGRYHGAGSSSVAAAKCSEDVRAGLWGAGLADSARAADELQVRLGLSRRPQIVELVEQADGSLRGFRIRRGPKVKPPRVAQDQPALSGAVG